MQLIGDALATTGYAASTTGLGVEAGIPLAALGNTMKYTGIGLEIMMDKKRNNYPKVYYNAGTNMAMYGVSKLGNFVPGPYNAVFNLLLLPVNATLDYGAGTLNSQNKK